MVEAGISRHRQGGPRGPLSVVRFDDSNTQSHHLSYGILLRYNLKPHPLHKAN